MKLIGSEMQLNRLIGVSMNLKYLKAAITIFGVFLVTQVFAGSDVLQAAQYSVFMGDVNGDGYPDYLVKAKIRIAMIDYDVPFPVPLKPPSPTFVLLSNSGGAYSLDSNPTSTVVNSTSWQPESYEMIFGDVQGIGNNSLLLQNRTAGAPSFLIAISAATGAPQLLEKLDASTVGYDLSTSDTTIELRDTSKDGRADLVIRVNGFVASVLTADASGLFHKPTSDQDGVVAAWRSFCAALDSGDVNSAAVFITADSQARYLSALGDLGSSITGLTNNWSDITQLAFKPNFAMYSITETVGGVTSLHILTFLPEGSGWKLSEF
jgi:hypothetical protein